MSVDADMKGLRIAITGASGFVGAALTAALEPFDVDILLLGRSQPVLPAAAGRARMTAEACDLTDLSAACDVIRRSDVIVHLAGLTDLKITEPDPRRSFSANVTPALTLLRAIEMVGLEDGRCDRRFVFASTVTVVGPAPPMPASEACPPQPITVYDRHKLCIENLLVEATQSGICLGASLRLANVYGYGRMSRNSNRSILNRMMRQALDGQALTYYGDGAYIRDFVHINDVARAFCAAITMPGTGFGRSYVISTGAGLSLRSAFETVAAAAREITGREAGVVSVPEPATLNRIERRNFIGDSSAFQMASGWRVGQDFSSAVRQDLASLNEGRS